MIIENNNLLSLKDLFDNTIFRIPDYQRGYSWEKKQLQDLWDDIINLKEDKSHYVGMLALKEVSINEYISENNELINLYGNNTYKMYYIVDGQQRLTTFIILINSLLNFLNKDKSNEDKIINKMKIKYIFESNKDEKIYKFGYEENNPTYNFLKENIFNGTKTSNDKMNYYTRKLEYANKFFNDKLKYYQENDLNNLLTKLENNFLFNVYLVTKQFDESIVFETMNNRGMKLSNLEILKNRLIYLNDLICDKNYNRFNDLKRKNIRDKINTTWATIYKFLGKNKEKSLPDDEYLKGHWIIYYTYTRKKGDDYKTYLFDTEFNPKNIDDPNFLDRIDKYTESLSNLCESWYNSYYPDDIGENEVKEYVNKLNRIGINYFRPLVATALYKYNNNYDELLLELLMTIERFIFINYRFAREVANKYNSEYYRFAHKLYECDNKEKCNDCINEIIKSLNNKIYDEEGNVKEYLVKDFEKRIKHYFDDRDGYYSWSDLHYFFFEYEEKLINKYKSPQKIPSWNYFVVNKKDKISIEHIYPQKPTNDWIDNFSAYNENERKCLTNSLGNLLALSLHTNISLQNDSFDEKKKEKKDENDETIRRGYRNGSQSEIEVSKIPTWTPKTIKDRGLKLLEFMKERWNIKFDEENKLDILGIGFMKEERESNAIQNNLNNSETEFNQDIIESTNYLDKLNEFTSNLYGKLKENLIKEIPNLIYENKNHYIALKSPNIDRVIADIRFNQSQVVIHTIEPLNKEIKTGHIVPISYRWTLNYRIDIYNEEDIDLAVKQIIDAYNQMINM